MPQKNDNEDPALREFLQVMQKRNQTNIWDNDVVASTVNKIGKDIKGSHHSVEKNQEKSINKFPKDKAAKREEDNVNIERQVKAPSETHDEAVFDMDYFRSKVKKDWSDSDDESGDDDGNVTGLEQDNDDEDDNDDGDDSVEGNQHENGVKNQSDVPIDEEEELLSPEKGVSVDYNVRMNCWSSSGTLVMYWRSSL